MPTNTAGGGPLRARRSAELLVAARGGGWAQVERLLDQGADANARGAHNVTALMLAARQGAVGAVTTLLAHRADPNAVDSQGSRSVLAYACGSKAECAPVIVKALLEAAADVRVHDAVGNTPLMVAAEVGVVEVAQALLGAGADVSPVARSEEPSYRRMGLTSRRVHDTLVVGKRYDPVLNYTERQRAQDLAEAQRTLEEQQEVLDDEEGEPLDMAKLDEAGALEMPSTPTILHDGLLTCLDSLTEESSEVVDYDYEYEEGKYFLSKVAPLRPQDLAKPLPTGAERQAHEAKAQALRSVVPRFDGSSETALVVAARSGHTDFCKVLLQHGADASAEDGKGQSALEVAAAGGHYKTCEALLAGRLPAAKARSAALAAAEAKGNHEVCMLLQGYKHSIPTT